MGKGIKLAPEIKDQVYDMLIAGTKQSLICEQLKISHSSVSRIAKEKQVDVPTAKPMQPTSTLSKGKRGAMTRKANKAKAEAEATKRQMFTIKYGGRDFIVPSSFKGIFVRPDGTGVDIL